MIPGGSLTRRSAPRQTLKVRALWLAAGLCLAAHFAWAQADAPQVTQPPQITPDGPLPPVPQLPVPQRRRPQTDNSQQPSLLVPVPGLADQDKPAQNAEPTPGIEGSSGADPNLRQMTPLEQRDLQIRQFDPTQPVSRDDSQPVSAAPQIQPTPDSSQQTRQPAVSNGYRPLPGSIAQSNLDAAEARNPGQGPRIVDETDDTQNPDYTGPAVLSRAYTLATPSVPRNVHLQPTVGFSMSYSEVGNATATVPTALSVMNTGGAPAAGTLLQNLSSLSYGLSWGVSGRHVFRRDQIGVNFSGSLSRVATNSLSGGNAMNLSLDWGHVLTKRLRLTVVEGAVISNQISSLQTQSANPDVSVANINFAASPVVQPLDSGTKQASTLVSLVWQKSSKLSLSASGGVFFVTRTGNQGLVGNTGYQASGDVNYRLTHKMTIGTYFSYSLYRYLHGISVGSSWSIGGIFSYAIGRSTQIRLRGGFADIESESLIVLPVPPPLDQILGLSFSLFDYYHNSTTSDLSVQIVRDLHRGKTLNAAYSRGVSPGNGQLLTSTQENATISYGQRLLRQYTLSLSAGWSRLDGGTAGTTSSTYASLGISRPLPRNVNSSLHFDYRRIQLLNTAGTQPQASVSFSVSWAPTEGPFHLW